MAAFALVLLLLASCTSPPQTDPSPNPSATTQPTVDDPDNPSVEYRVAVVVAPDPDLRAAAAEVGARRLASTVEGLGEVRVVAADRTAAMADLVRHFASEGYDLVCALGPGALDAVLAAANDLPAVRFCATPVIAGEIPGNVLAVDIRSEEAAYLAGVAAGTHAPEQPPVMMIGPASHASARQQQAFRDGFASTSPPEGVVPFVLGPVDDAEAAGAVLEEHLRAGVSVIYTDAGGADVGVREAAAAESERRAEARATPDPDATEDPSATAPTRVLVVGGPDLLLVEEGEPVPAAVAYVVEVQWDLAVRMAAEQLIAEWDGGVVSLGLLEGALRFVESDAGNVSPVVRTRVEDTGAGIIDGRLVIRPQS